MIIGDAGVKNGIFITEGEKIWRNHGIREKREKDPYNISEERRMIFLGWPLGIPLAPVGGSSMNPVEFRQKNTTNVEQVIGQINCIAPLFIIEEVYIHTIVDPPQSMHMHRAAQAVVSPKSRSGPGTPMIVSSPSMSPIYSPHPSVKVPIFEQLLPRLFQCCYGSSWPVQICGVIGLGALVGKVTVEKGWISWGNYYDMAFKETHDEIWLEYTMNCFLQAIKFGIPTSRSHLGRV
uniref:Transformation/transcription domain-associated protein-like n=1 Tax=Tanacetum cinerariifolium TaxID=118510 RepID=A0A6L2NJD0_TANCI|nr:transformation/transcription domain-associated protein-like [Tanacetum cinerariifolium]